MRSIQPATNRQAALEVCVSKIMAEEKRKNELLRLRERQRKFKDAK